LSPSVGGFVDALLIWGEDARTYGDAGEPMRLTMKAVAALAVGLTALLGVFAPPAFGQAAANGCPPGQPSGRPPGQPPTQPGRPDGRPPSYPPGRCQLALSQSAATRGESFQASGSGFVPGETVTLSFAGRRSTVVASPDGTFGTTLTVPADAPLGRTQVRATGASLELEATLEIVGGRAQGSGAGGRVGAASNDLPRTGGPWGDFAVLGVVLTVLGTALVIVARRRRSAGTSPTA
jgi:hypothetical protein